MDSNSPKVICCGHAAYDLNFMMDEYPVEDRKYKIDELVQTGGGPASNAASLLAAWGVPTAFAGVIGDDLYGRLILEELTESGVNTSLIQIDPDKNTPLSAVIVNTSSGSRTLLNRRNEDDQPGITPQAISALHRMSPSVLHFDGHALNLSLKMIEMFPDASVVIDAGSFRESTDKLCSLADYAICSRRFAEVCTGLDDITSAPGRAACMDSLRRRYKETIVVTLGAEGLFYSEGGPLKSMDAYKTAAVDSTGAGDIFHAAFSYGQLKGFSLEDKLKTASAAAAISVTRAGARTSIPGLEESLKLAGLGH